jgi:hypothetical protein
VRFTRSRVHAQKLVNHVLACRLASMERAPARLRWHVLSL